MLTLLKSDLKTSDVLTCEVSNNATLAREDVTARTLRTSTRIDVHSKYKTELIGIENSPELSVIITALITMVSYI